jgi:hypothetical protein
MSRYEEIDTRIRNLLEAERRCRLSGNIVMADIWQRDRMELINRRERMTLEQAVELAVI